MFDIIVLGGIIKNIKWKEKVRIENEIVLFENQNVKLEVNMMDETVWLNKEQMAQLFNVDRSGILNT